MIATFKRSTDWVKLIFSYFFFGFQIYLFRTSTMPHAESFVTAIIFFLLIYTYLFFSARTIIKVTPRKLVLHTLTGQAHLDIAGIRSVQFKQRFLNRLFDFVTIHIIFTDGAAKNYHCAYFNRAEGQQFIETHLRQVL